jgi:serine/threonine protein kinase
MFFQGTFSHVVQYKGFVYKVSNVKNCNQAIKDISFAQHIPFAIKPITYDISGGHCHIIYPNAGHPINDEIWGYNIELKKKLAYELINKINLIHQNDIAHNDLMDGNILYSPDEVNIIDWGNAAQLGARLQYEIYTEYYKSPENKMYNRCSPKDDIWAIGINLLKLLGDLPPSQSEYLFNKYKTDIAKLCRKTISDIVLKELLMSAIFVQKSKRYNAGMILKHSYFNEFYTNKNLGTRFNPFAQTSIQYITKSYEEVDKRELIMYLEKVAKLLYYTPIVYSNLIQLFCATLDTEIIRLFYKKFGLEIGMLSCVFVNTNIFYPGTYNTVKYFCRQFKIKKSMARDIDVFVSLLYKNQLPDFVFDNTMAKTHSSLEHTTIYWLNNIIDGSILFEEEYGTPTKTIRVIGSPDDCKSNVECC